MIWASKLNLFQELYRQATLSNNLNPCLANFTYKYSQDPYKSSWGLGILALIKGCCYHNIPHAIKSHHSINKKTILTFKSPPQTNECIVSTLQKTWPHFHWIGRLNFFLPQFTKVLGQFFWIFGFLREKLRKGSGLNHF